MAARKDVDDSSGSKLPVVETYDLVSDLDEAGDKALWATIGGILAKRAAAAEAAGVGTCLPDSSTETQRTSRSDE